MRPDPLIAHRGIVGLHLSVSGRAWRGDGRGEVIRWFRWDLIGSARAEVVGPWSGGGGGVLTRVGWGGGGDLVPTMPGCVCPKVKFVGRFQLQGSEISENISLKMGVQFTTSIWMRMFRGWEGGGGDLVPNYAWICVSKSEVLFSFKPKGVK